MAGAATTRVPPSRVLLVASFGAFLAFLDATIVNVAFPSIRESFAGTTISELSWVLNAYNIVFAASLILCGRLTDLVGRRRSFVAGVAVFTVASGLCGIAPSVELLVLARVVQAFGAAMLVPASLALVIAAFPAERRAHAIGVWGATAAVAAGVGPPIGGALVELGGWRWAFLVNLPFGLVAVWAARHELVESRAPGRRTVPDLVGAVLLVLSLALLNLAIVKGSDWGWASPAVLGPFAGAVLAFGLFVVSSRRHRAPMLDPMLLRLPSFRWGSAATIAAGFGFYAYLLTNVLWLQYVWGYDVLRAGLALVPGAVVAALVASRLGPLADRHGYRAFVVPGALVWAAAYVWYHQRVGLQPAFWAEWMPGQVLSGIGVGATLPLLGSAALAAVPGGRYATASAVVSSARQIGGVLGIALLVVVLGEPTPRDRGRVVPAGMGAVDRRLPRRRRPGGAARPAAVRTGGRGRRRRAPARRPPARRPCRVGGPGRRGRRPHRPLRAADVRGAPGAGARAPRAGHPPGRPAGGRGARRRGRPAGVGLRRAHRPARGAPRRGGRPRARPGPGARRARPAQR